MRTTVNPGSRLMLEGRFELGMSLVEVQQRGGAEQLDGRERAYVVDVESGTIVTLADLLRSLLADPTDVRTGPIRITIEPTRI